MKAVLLPTLCLLATLSVADAQEPESPDTAKLPAMREVQPGVLEIGPIRVDKHASTVTFPGRLNMETGLLEYLIVTPTGSTHESLLVSEIEPRDLHLAMLLLGAKGAGITTPGPEQTPPGQIDKEYLKNAPKLKGDAVSISVKWKATDGAEQQAPVEDWLVRGDSKKRVERGPWIYTGSMFREDQFLAQAQGLTAAIITNPSALINNPRKGNDSDLIWEVNERAVPPDETPVVIVLKLENPEPKP